MQREYWVFCLTAWSFSSKDQAVRLSVVDGIDENTIELLLLAQAKHEIAVKIG
ncbi:hypothetical protein BPMI_02602 [Candidatus Burkholderia pumila]|uniref:Uncharacterized protein n=1 Tax=Candidatus Burkholderia pumila TaxID=1090375 RepID=A0ABR5HN92_9BURK|nr:hypothetical protein BPMI_02602 [Candidatus Burkholderia pumila]